MTGDYHLNALSPGAMLHEYQVLEVLGEGSFGIVYLTKGRYLGDLVAIKEYLPADLATRLDGTTVRPASSGNEESFLWGLKRFLEEARMLHQFATPQPHPNIVAVRRFFVLNGTAYLVMDFEEGEALSKLLARQTRLPEAQVRVLATSLMDGLEVVHRAGITHRDIKPSNILFRKDGSPVLLDFGAARVALGEQTKSSFNAISPAYAAPEQLVSSDRVGPWTDIYGLAATLYRAVTGELPQPAVERLIDDCLVPASHLARGECSAELLRAIDAGLVLRAEDRVRSIALWRDVLEGAGYTNVPTEMHGFGDGDRSSSEARRSHFSEKLKTPRSGAADRAPDRDFDRDPRPTFQGVGAGQSRESTRGSSFGTGREAGDREAAFRGRFDDAGPSLRGERRPSHGFAPKPERPRRSSLRLAFFAALLAGTGVAGVGFAKFMNMPTDFNLLTLLPSESVEAATPPGETVLLPDEQLVSLPGSRSVSFPEEQFDALAEPRPASADVDPERIAAIEQRLSGIARHRRHIGEQHRKAQDFERQHEAEEERRRELEAESRQLAEARLNEAQLAERNRAVQEQSPQGLVPESSSQGFEPVPGALPGVLEAAAPTIEAPGTEASGTVGRDPVGTQASRGLEAERGGLATARLLDDLRSEGQDPGSAQPAQTPTALLQAAPEAPVESPGAESQGLATGQLLEDLRAESRVLAAAPAGQPSAPETQELVPADLIEALRAESQTAGTGQPVPAADTGRPALAAQQRIPSAGAAALQPAGLQSLAPQQARIVESTAPLEAQREQKRIESFLEENREAAETGFEIFIVQQGLLDAEERFQRVLSFGGVDYQGPDHVVSVEYLLCVQSADVCQERSNEARFRVRMEVDQLRFGRL